MALHLSGSLSLCVGKLLRGDPLPEGPYVIVSCTRFDTMEDAVDTYMKSYWEDYPLEAVQAMLQKVWPHLIQPRKMAHFTADYQHYANNGEWVVLKGEHPSEVWKALEAQSLSMYEGDTNPYEEWYAQLQMEAMVMLRADNGMWPPRG